MDTATEVLRASTITSDRVTLPGIQLDRKLYQDVNNVLSKAGGKWNRKAGAHLFNRDPREALAEYLESGKIVSVQQQLQAFYTPEPVIERMVEMADLQIGQRALEPSAGDGRIARRMLDMGCVVDVCEIDEVRQRELQANPGYRLVGCDFLNMNPPEESDRYDRIVMNPPFTKGQDIAHVMHAWRCLKHSGVLVAITSPGWIFRTDKKHVAFREFVNATGVYEELPEGTFKESGTNVRTMLIQIFG